MRLRKPVVESGNSLAVRLSRKEAQALGVRKGDVVDLDVRPAAPGLLLDPKRFFRDGRGSTEHDQEIGDAAAQGR